MYFLYGATKLKDAVSTPNNSKWNRGGYVLRIDYNKKNNVKEVSMSEPRLGGKKVGRQRSVGVTC